MEAGALQSEFALGGDEDGWVATHRDPALAGTGVCACVCVCVCARLSNYRVTMVRWPRTGIPPLLVQVCVYVHVCMCVCVVVRVL
jgi:hypothetical protein